MYGTFTIQINQIWANIPVPWILWDTDCFVSAKRTLQIFRKKKRPAICAFLEALNKDLLSQSKKYVRSLEFGMEILGYRVPHQKRIQTIDRKDGRYSIFLKWKLSSDFATKRYHAKRNLWFSKPKLKCRNYLQKFGEGWTWPAVQTCSSTEFLAVLYVGVSKNKGTPKSSILIGFSIINHPFWGTPIFGNTHVFVFIEDWGMRAIKSVLVVAGGFKRDLAGCDGC